MIKLFDKSRESSKSALFDAVEAKDNNLIGKKIQEERQARKMSLTDLSAELEKYGVSVQRSSINKWELGQTVPSAYQMLALCTVFGIDDSVSYFSGRQSLNMEGRKKVADYKADLEASGRYTPQPAIKEIVYLRMPVSLLSASAGTGNFLDDENFEMVEYPENSVPAGADFGIKVCGDSMEPVYSNGQTVWVQECSSLHPGEVGIFTLDGCGYIKMFSEQEPNDIETYTDSTGVLHMQPVLISYNHNYAPIVVSGEQELKIVGRVL